MSRTAAAVPRLSLLALVALASSVTCAAPEGPPPRAPTRVVVPAAEGELVLFGVPLCAPLDEARAAAPELVEAASAGESVVNVERDVGFPATVRVGVRDGHVASVALEARGPAVTEAAFRSLRPGLERALGPCRAVRCERDEEGAPSFSDQLAAGGAQLSYHVETERVFGRLGLERPPYGSVEGLSVQGWLTCRAHAPDAEDLFDAPKDWETPGARAKEGSGAPGCTVDLSSAPAASSLGFDFGASRAAIVATLDATTTEEAFLGELILPHEEEGARGRAILRFYDGCLAVVMFVVTGEDATESSYRSLQGALASRLGPGRWIRCVSDDEEPLDEVIAAGPGLLHTDWRDTAPVTADLSFRRAGVGDAPVELVLETRYEPLSAHAPDIDFGD